MQSRPAAADASAGAADTPVLAMVSRLVSHKGFDLVRYAMEEMLRMGMQVVILGSGEQQYEDFFAEMQWRTRSRWRLPAALSRSFPAAFNAVPIFSSCPAKQTLRLS